MQNKKSGVLMLIQLEVTWERKWKFRHIPLLSPHAPPFIKAIAAQVLANNFKAEWKIAGYRLPNGFAVYTLCDNGHQQPADMMLAAQATSLLQFNNLVQNYIGPKSLQAIIDDPEFYTEQSDN